MRAAAPLAFALRSSKADHGRKLGPVDGVEPSIAGMDRHQGSALVVCVRNNLGHLFSLTLPSSSGLSLAARARRSLPQNRSPRLAEGPKRPCETLSRPSPFTRAGPGRLVR